MSYINESHIKALTLLAKYKYLTSSQFVKMGLYGKRAYLTNSLKMLMDIKKPLLAKHNFNPLNGKLESFYYLTKNGKKFLIEEHEYNETQIKTSCNSATVYLKDYFHRKFTIDFHIRFNEWIEASNGKVDFLYYYFDKSGNNRSSDNTRRVTALNKLYIDTTNSFIPDINCLFTFNNQKYLYLFEQHNGKDTKRLFDQLYTHIIAISKGGVSEKYNIKKAHIVIVICEYESVKLSVIERLQKKNGIENYNNLFLFKTNSELAEKSFNENWSLIDGKLIDFNSLLCKFK